MASTILYGPEAPSLVAATAFQLGAVAPPPGCNAAVVTALNISTYATAVAATLTIGDDSGLFAYDAHTFSTTDELWRPNIGGIVLLSGQFLTLTSNVTTSALLVELVGYYAANLVQVARTALTTAGTTFTPTPAPGQNTILGFSQLSFSGGFQNTELYPSAAGSYVLLDAIPATSLTVWRPNLMGSMIPNGQGLRVNTNNGGGGGNIIVCGYYG